MGKRWIMVLVGVCVMGVLMKGPLTSAMGRKPPLTSTVSGKVTLVDLKDSRRQSVTVKPTQGQAVALRIDPKNTLMLKGGKHMAVSSIRIGDTLRADYEIRRDHNLAKRLVVETPKAAKPQAKSSATPTKKSKR